MREIRGNLFVRHCSVVIGTGPGSQLAEHSEKIILISTTIITEIESFTSLADLFIGAQSTLCMMSVEGGVRWRQDWSSYMCLEGVVSVR